MWGFLKAIFSNNVAYHLCISHFLQCKIHKHTQIYVHLALDMSFPTPKWFRLGHALKLAAIFFNRVFNLCFTQWDVMPFFQSRVQNLFHKEVAISVFRASKVMVLPEEVLVCSPQLEVSHNILLSPPLPHLLEGQLFSLYHEFSTSSPYALS